ncbi:Late embryogenesis abundant protein [Sesbania bispinosa]|nr:Late embryogenesis abundant protein [Sesbania bispinosa]
MSELASKRRAMTETQDNKQDQEQLVMIPQKKKRRGCVIAIGVVLLLLLVLVTVSLVLALTLFKTKEPRTKLVSATLEGISPSVTFPAIDIKINVTLDLKILVENRNHASFKHQEGTSLLLYKGKQVGDTDIYPGLIPARGSTTLPCRLTLQADKLASNMTCFVGDLLGGQISMETVTEIPGKVSFLGIIKKHIVAKSNCQFTFGFPDLEIKSQICKNKAKL